MPLHDEKRSLSEFLLCKDKTIYSNPQTNLHIFSVRNGQYSELTGRRHTVSYHLVALVSR